MSINEAKERPAGTMSKGAPRQRCPPRGPNSDRHCDRCGTIFGGTGLDYDCCTHPGHYTRMCITCDCPDCIPLTAEEENGVFRSQAPAPAWVACAERLPDTIGPRLVYGELDEDSPNMIAWAFFTSSKKWAHDNDFYSGITHWMELPSPPQAEEKV